MRLTKEALKQIIKEELESIQQEIMAPYGLNPYKYPQQGTVGEYRWKASIMSGSNTASELSVDLEVTNKDGKTVVLEIPRMFRHAVATMLGKLSNEPAEAQKFIEKAVREGKPKQPPRQGRY